MSAREGSKDDLFADTVEKFRLKSFLRGMPNGGFDLFECGVRRVRTKAKTEGSLEFLRADIGRHDKQGVLEIRAATQTVR